MPTRSPGVAPSGEVGPDWESRNEVCHAVCGRSILSSHHAVLFTSLPCACPLLIPIPRATRQALVVTGDKQGPVKAQASLAVRPCCRVTLPDIFRLDNPGPTVGSPVSTGMTLHEAAIAGMAFKLLTWAGFAALVRLSAAEAVGNSSLAYSEPSYPSPWMNPQAVGWEEAYAKAKDFVSQLTLLEKVNLTTGVGWVFLQPRMPRVLIPGQMDGRAVRRSERRRPASWPAQHVHAVSAAPVGPRRIPH